MEDPAREVSNVIQRVTGAEKPEEQESAILKYFAQDAGFQHPLCKVNPGPGSRDVILGIYQWYHWLSPRTKINVENITYNSDTHEVFAECVQWFRPRYSPVHPSPARLLVRLKLKPDPEHPDHWVIAHQDDWFHPEDIATYIFPPLRPVIGLLLKLGAVAYNTPVGVCKALHGLFAVGPFAARKTA